MRWHCSLPATLAAVVAAECSGGGNSGSSGSTSITVTIPSATSSSSDINLLGDFSPEYARDNFHYVIYYKKNSTTSEKKSAKAGGEVTFNDVKYDTYDFVLEIYVDENKNENTLLDTITKTETVSASNNTVTFPDMSTSKYSEWFFVSTTDQLTDALSKILPETSSFSASKKAKICLKGSIEYNDAENIKNNDKIKIIENGYSFAAHLYTVTLPSDLPEGCSVTTNNADNKFAEDVTVTLTVTAGTGYKFKSISYGVPGSAAQYEPTEFEQGVTYTFQMPANDVSVSARFIPVYTITYNLNEGAAVADSGFESTAQYTEDDFVSGVYALPGGEGFKREGYLFYGWYTDATCSGTKVTQIASTDVLENKTFYARWIDSIYVKSDGVNTNDGLTANTAVDAIATAVTKIQTYASALGDTNFNWKIVVVGALTGTQTINNFSSAASLEITGGESGGILNGNGNTTNSVLSINCAIPVTIKNLTIKNGAKLSGAGIYIDNDNANVTLGAGAKVTGNKCSTTAASTGGGIYVNKGKLTVDTGAEVTDNESQGVASGQSVGSGGGIAYYINTTVIVRGKVSGNVANADGSDIYAVGFASGGSGTLILESGAEIGNIHLRRNQAITVNDPSFNPATNITVGIDTATDYYKADRVVLTGSAVDSVYSKFTLTNAGPYKIGDTGTLVAKDVNEFALEDLNSFNYSSGLATVDGSRNITNYINKILVLKFTTVYTVIKLTDYDSVDGFTGKSTVYSPSYSPSGRGSLDTFTKKKYIASNGAGIDNNVGHSTYLCANQYSSAPHTLSLVGSCSSALIQ